MALSMGLEGVPPPVSTAADPATPSGGNLLMRSADEITGTGP
ncbi:hypothetical protein [Natrialba swarupiae]|nr:hypothetical protein [Natrialba swarupiae]